MKIIHKEFLPTQTNSVHASCVEIWNGNPVFSWFGGSREGNGDVSIFVYNLNNEKEKFVLGNADNVPRWNPILVNLNDKLILFEKAGIFCDRWQTFVHDISEWDNDLKVSEIRQAQQVLEAGLNGPVKSRPLIKDNRLICGSSVETFFNWSSYIEEYTIGSKTYHSGEDKDIIHFYSRSEPLSVDYVDRPMSGSYGLIQPTLWDYNDKLFCFFRSSRGLNRIYFSESSDWNSESEVKWSKPIPTNLENPNSAVDVATNEDSLFLLYNPDSSSRYPLVLSKFNLKSFLDSDKQNLEADETIVISDDLNSNNFQKHSCMSPELSYPYMILSENKLHMTYTYGRSKIEYVVVEI